MTEEIKLGGGHYTCNKCGETHYGSTLHFCKDTQRKHRMSEDFKKWLCDKSKFDIAHWLLNEHEELSLLIKAMWAINREGKWEIISDKVSLDISDKHGDFCISFYYSDHNNSEQEALTKALEYIFDKETQNGNNNIQII